MIGYQWQAGGVIWVLDQSLVALVLDWETRCWVFNDPVTCDCSSCCSPQIVVANPPSSALALIDTAGYGLQWIYFSDTSLQMRDIQCNAILSTPSQIAKSSMMKLAQLGRSTSTAGERWACPAMSLLCNELALRWACDELALQSRSHSWSTPQVQLKFCLQHHCTHCCWF